MRNILTHSASAVAVGAALSMAATPAAAADLPSASIQNDTPAGFTHFEKKDADVAHHRGYRYGRYGYGYRHRYRNRVDAGDVLAGVLIIGGIAAIASAANNSNKRDVRDDRYRNRDYRYRDSDYQPRRGDSRYAPSGQGLQNAVSMCVREVERDVRVESVDNVDRTASGWRVTGAIYNGSRFSCQIDSNGRIDGVNIGGAAASAATPRAYPAPAAQPVQDRQWSNDRYAQVWAKVERQEANGQQAFPQQQAAARVPVSYQNTQQPAQAGQNTQDYGERRFSEEDYQRIPAYPGGPVPGEDAQTPIDGDLVQSGDNSANGERKGG